VPRCLVVGWGNRWAWGIQSAVAHVSTEFLGGGLCDSVVTFFGARPVAEGLVVRWATPTVRRSA
jgi:hypothetical protein